jgi:hypothetical protein
VHLAQHREIAAADALVADHHAVADHGELQHPVRGLPGPQRTSGICKVLRARSSGQASVQVTMNGWTSASCTPAAARSARASRLFRLASAVPALGSAAADQAAASAKTPRPRLCPARPELAPRLCGHSSPPAARRPTLSPRNGAQVGPGTGSFSIRMHPSQTQTPSGLCRRALARQWCAPGPCLCTEPPAKR